MFAITYQIRARVLQAIRVPQSVSGACIVLVTAVTPASVLAETALPATQQTALAIVGQLPQPQRSPIDDYLDAIDNARIDGGTYSMVLADLYLGLGQALLKEREYDRAKEAFQQAMQIERVNKGLYSASQIPYLFSIAEIDQQLGNRKALKKVLKNIYQINATLYTAEDERRLPVLQRLLDWYLDSYERRFIPAEYSGLLISAQLAAQIASIVEVNNGLEYPGTLESLRTVGHVNYLIVDHLNIYGQPEESGFVTSSARTLSQPSFSERTTTFYRDGKYALARVVEGLSLQEQRTPAETAAAIAELADWYLVFGQRQSASRTYQLAFEALQEDQQAALLQEQLFGQPRQIGFIAPRGEQDLSEQVKISMMVNARGKAKSIKVLETPVELKTGQLRKIKRALRARHFRPRLVNGEPQTAENFVIYFPLSSTK